MAFAAEFFTYWVRHTNVSVSASLVCEASGNCLGNFQDRPANVVEQLGDDEELSVAHLPLKVWPKEGGRHHPTVNIMGRPQVQRLTHHRRKF